jgi:PHD/YefM family antitoxin component YafN of YafNO toxin-antitoxin module
MTLNDKIAELKIQYPTLTKGVNDQVIDIPADEYEATIVKWAEYELQQEAIDQAAKVAEAAKEVAQAKLAALGLTTDDLKALGL